MTGSVQIQTVLYRQGLDAARRWLAGVCATVGQARAAGVSDEVAVAIGDCSTPGRLGRADVETLRGQAEAAGLNPTGVRYEAFGENLGSGGAHNQLFDTAFHHSLVVNPDAVLSPTCLRELTLAMADPAVGIAEARQIPLEHPKAYDANTGDTSWASGACMLIHREVLKATGGFDADTFPLYGDDVDLSWRARLAGWRVCHVPTAVVFHDKRLNRAGTVVPGEGEVDWSTRIALLLPWKYARPDLVEERLEVFRASGNEPLRQAADEFVRRRQAGQLPSPVEGAAAVAEFVEDHYGVHRFAYPAGPN